MKIEITKHKKTCYRKIVGCAIMPFRKETDFAVVFYFIDL